MNVEQQHEYKAKDVFQDNIYNIMKKISVSITKPIINDHKSPKHVIQKGEHQVGKT